MAAATTVRPDIYGDCRAEVLTVRWQVLFTLFLLCSLNVFKD